jgi:2-haloalkanoic acid dehalogenase type II
MASWPEVATFDCYGTLIDWEGGLAAFLYDFALRHGQTAEENGDALRRRWEAIQFALVQDPYRPYKEILAASLQQWAKERDLPYREEDGEALIRSMRSWQPFPDTRPALLQAREQGVQLAILSNTDRDIIAHSLQHLDIPFDLVVTAEDVGAYKPSSANFSRLLDELGRPAESLLHVAFGFKYDIGPANAAGIRSAWVNRHVAPTPPGAEPDFIWRDLWSLPQLVGGAGPEIP